MTSLKQCGQKVASVALTAFAVAMMFLVDTAAYAQLDIGTDIDDGISQANTYISQVVVATVLVIAARIGVKWLRRAG